MFDIPREMSDEDQRAVRENLSEEELTLIDILTKPAPDLTDKERSQVKAVCRDLLKTLKREKLVLDWRKKECAIADVRYTLEVTLDNGLPDSYDENIYDQKCDAAFHHVLSSYYGAGRSVYAQ